MPVSYKLYTFNAELMVEVLDGEFASSRFTIKNVKGNSKGDGVTLEYDIFSQWHHLTEGKNEYDLYSQPFKDILSQIANDLLTNLVDIRVKIINKEIEEYVIQPLAQE